MKQMGFLNELKLIHGIVPMIFDYILNVFQCVLVFVSGGQPAWSILW